MTLPGFTDNRLYIRVNAKVKSEKISGNTYVVKKIIGKEETYH